jgi:hypothetical protein
MINIPNTTMSMEFKCFKNLSNIISRNFVGKINHQFNNKLLGQNNQAMRLFIHNFRIKYSIALLIEILNRYMIENLFAVNSFG